MREFGPEVKELIALSWQIVAPAWLIVILVGTVYSVWLEGYLRKNKPKAYKKLINLGMTQCGLGWHTLGQGAHTLGWYILLDAEERNRKTLYDEKEYDKETLYYLRIVKLFWLLICLPIILVIATVIVYHCFLGLCS